MMMGKAKQIINIHQQNHHVAPIFIRFIISNGDEIISMKELIVNITSVEVIFNEPLSVGVLPASSKQLAFGASFNHPITAGVLPESLQQLVFSYDFNHPITASVLPSSLQQLTFFRNSIVY